MILDFEKLMRRQEVILFQTKLLQRPWIFFYKVKPVLWKKQDNYGIES